MEQYQNYYNEQTDVSNRIINIINERTYDSLNAILRENYENIEFDNISINTIINNLHFQHTNIEAFRIIENNACVLNYLIRTIDYRGDLNYGDILNEYRYHISNIYLQNRMV